MAKKTKRSLNEDLDFGEITENLLKTIARNEELSSILATTLGLSDDEFGLYIDTVEFPVIGRKTKTDL